jgi:hypothetical protein
MLEEAAGLQRHSDEDSCNLSSKDRYAKLPAMPTKRKKITKFSQSHKEINQIYQSIHNLMRQAHKEMK